MDIKKKIISTIRVELIDEFDLNFERKAFFDRPWAPAKHDPGIGSLMIRTARLRNSIRASDDGNSIRFDSDAAYAEIHNTGGVIYRNVSITPKLRRWAWAMYYKSKDEKYKGMALTKKSTIRQTINMPQRQYIGGNHPKVAECVNNTSYEITKDYLEKALKRIIINH